MNLEVLISNLNEKIIAFDPKAYLKIDMYRWNDKGSDKIGRALFRIDLEIHASDYQIKNLPRAMGGDDISFERAFINCLNGMRKAIGDKLTDRYDARTDAVKEYMDHLLKILSE